MMGWSSFLRQFVFPQDHLEHPPVQESIIHAEVTKGDLGTMQPNKKVLHISSDLTKKRQS